MASLVEHEPEVLVPQTVGPQSGKHRNVDAISIDEQGDLHIVPCPRISSRTYTLTHPDGAETTSLSNLYEVEMAIINHGLLCHESAGEELEESPESGLRSPSSWKWAKRTVGHTKKWVQRLCDIDGKIWTLSVEPSAAQ